MSETTTIPGPACEHAVILATTLGPRCGYCGAEVSVRPAATAEAICDELFAVQLATHPATPCDDCGEIVCRCEGSPLWKDERIAELERDFDALRGNLRRLRRYGPTIQHDGDTGDVWAEMQMDDDAGYLSRREVFEAIAPPTDVERGAGLRRREGA